MRANDSEWILVFVDQNEVNYSNQQIVENRSAYYPNLTGDLTGSQGNGLARIGAGDITSSRLYNRNRAGWKTPARKGSAT
jgi:outer membrane protein TolC